MGITLKQNMVIATVVGQQDIVPHVVGKKTVFSPDQAAEYDWGFTWLKGPLEELAARSLATGEFRLCSIKNPLQEEQELTVMVDPCLPPHELIILGGGHVAKSLGDLGKLLGYVITVVDDREDFVTEQRFPQADRRIYCSFDDLALHLSPGPRTSVVIVTRGHKHDWNCLQQMLKYPLQYLGVIGSRRKVALLREKMLAEGYAEAECNRIYMPIGIDIGAQTPEEIAISIAAELIKVRRGGQAASLKMGADEPVTACAAEISSAGEMNVIEKAVEAAEQGIPAALATIIASQGSTPRKAGSRMLVLNDGAIYGTIGGGIGEAQIGKEALRVIASGLPEITTVAMNAENAAMEGMVCGGTIDVFIEPVDELGRVLVRRT
jgi:xanthine dehydrogenase accessory factor